MVQDLVRLLGIDTIPGAFVSPFGAYFHVKHSLTGKGTPSLP
ncbi:MAG: hypothetical protein ACYTF1_12255 [Planctomycetota bacterium]|jgi:hypothetical protein